jgi:dihydrofolate reductase
MKYFKAIAAMALNRVIGRGGQIPWHLPEDFRWFKQATMGHILVMGRRTFESIGHSLPGRTTVVLTQAQLKDPGVRTIRSLSELDPAVEVGDVYIAGGARLYADALPFCSDLYLTLVLKEVDGDVFFPPFEHRFEPVAVLRQTEQFRVIHYRNLTPENPPGYRQPPIKE